ncbi:MAG: 50S ribosomal protein L23 [Clostridium sp.]|jgi:large subunit ribosomal protein L23|nr:50S ribosomal protein L23 [Clostridium sp.]MCI5841791.1 50S ribosomal protein L23 [Clostridium sp.]MDY5895705.1 50S ribosomal protein L23 [Oscillospiraceae bacterium]CDC11677.1 50S ribosomal protein L23 [Clostridium sp. CAG:413]
MSRIAQDIILRPVITENSMDGIADRKYTFEVAKDANKIEIAKAVEELFGVKVSKVNTINVDGKLRRYGRFEGYTASRKKAIVTLTEDSKAIEFFDGMM